jgi:hypothetical protein
MQEIGETKIYFDVRICMGIWVPFSQFPPKSSSRTPEPNPVRPGRSSQSPGSFHFTLITYVRIYSIGGARYPNEIDGNTVGIDGKFKVKS